MRGHGGDVACNSHWHRRGRAAPALLVRLASAMQALAHHDLPGPTEDSRAAQTDGRFLPGAKAPCALNVCSRPPSPLIAPPPCALAQIVTRVGGVFKVAMPASVAALLNVFDFLNLSIDAFGLPLSCLQLGSFFDQLLFLVLSPGLLGLFPLVCSLGIEVLTKSEAASVKAGVIRALPYLLYILFFAFPLVSSRAFQALDCEEFFDDGTNKTTHFLRADYSLDCDDPEYTRVVFLSWVAIALYPVGVPLLYLTLLLCARKAILTEQPTALSRSLTFLHQDYELSMYWWEMVEIAKKASCPQCTAHDTAHTSASSELTHLLRAIRSCSSWASACSSGPALRSSSSLALSFH